MMTRLLRKSKGKFKKFLETNDNENIANRNLCDVLKAVLRGKFKAIQSYLKKQEKDRIDNLNLHINNWKKEKQQQKSTKLAEGKKSQNESRNK